MLSRNCISAELSKKEKVSHTLSRPIVSQSFSDDPFALRTVMRAACEIIFESGITAGGTWFASSVKTWNSQTLMSSTSLGDWGQERKTKEKDIGLPILCPDIFAKGVAICGFQPLYRCKRVLCVACGEDFKKLSYANPFGICNSPAGLNYGSLLGTSLSVHGRDLSSIQDYVVDRGDQVRKSSARNRIRI